MPEQLYNKKTAGKIWGIIGSSLIVCLGATGLQLLVIIGFSKL